MWPHRLVYCLKFDRDENNNDDEENEMELIIHSCLILKYIVSSEQ